jgi:hypothetical protein
MWLFFFFPFSLDNSEAVNNTDFLPSRLEVERAAIYEMAETLLRASPLMSRVGLITMTPHPQLIVPLTANLITFHKKLYGGGVRVQSGTIDPVASIRTASLMIRSGSQLTEDGRGSAGLAEPEFIAKLRQERLGLDIIVFGSADECTGPTTRLGPLVKRVGANAQVLSVPIGKIGQDLAAHCFNHLQSFAGIMRPILAGFSMDTRDELDDDLMMAIMLSMEDAKKEQNARAQVTSAAPVSKQQPARLPPQSKYKSTPASAKFTLKPRPETTEMVTTTTSSSDANEESLIPNPSLDSLDSHDLFKTELKSNEDGKVAI